MNAKLKNSVLAWVDLDDAPELTEADFARGAWRVGDAEVPQAVARAALRRGKPSGGIKAGTKQSVTVRYSPDVLAGKLA